MVKWLLAHSILVKLGGDLFYIYVRHTCKVVLIFKTSCFNLVSKQNCLNCFQKFDDIFNL